MEQPSFKEALWFWLKLGFISFGGPAGQIAIMHELLVEKKRWISESRFLHALNYTMLLPGPEAQQLATYSGWLLHGVKGGLVAGLLFILPSVFILLGLSSVYVSYGTIPWVYALFEGLKPAIMSIVLLALIKIGKKSLKHAFHYLMAIGAFIGMYFFNIPFPSIIIGAFVLYFLTKRFFPDLVRQDQTSLVSQDLEEDGYFINQSSQLQNSGFSFPRLIKQILITIAIWSLPFILFFLFSNDLEFWKTVSFFFTKAAFVTFGGAYAVLPYVAQVSVEELNWLTKLQMIDGLALGETTPGPLVMVLVFVGYMAGYNHFGSSLLMGSFGLLATTFFTFVPCFFFIFAGAPIIEKTRNNQPIKEALSLVTAAVVGVILNLTIYLGTAVLFPTEITLIGIDWTTFAWILISFIALYRFKVNMITWIGISALFGLMRYLVG